MSSEFRDASIALREELNIAKVEAARIAETIRQAQSQAGTGKERAALAAAAAGLATVRAGFDMLTAALDRGDADE